MKDIVISFTWGTGPNMSCHIPQFLHILEISDEDLMVNSCPEAAGPEEMNTVQIRYVYTPCIWWGAIRAVFLHMHPKKAHIDSIDLLKSEECFGTIWERFRHLSRIHKP